MIQVPIKNNVYVTKRACQSLGLPFKVPIVIEQVYDDETALVTIPFSTRTPCELLLFSVPLVPPVEPVPPESLGTIR